MADCFTLDDWADFVEASDAFSIKVTGYLNPKKIVVVCSDGFEIFNEELYGIAMDLLDHDEGWVEVYHSEINRTR